MTTIRYIIIFTLFSHFSLYAHDVGDWCQSGTIKDLGQVVLSQQELANELSDGVTCLLPVADSSLFPQRSDQKNILDFISPVIFKQHGQLDDPDVPNFTDGEVQSEDIKYRTSLAYAYCTCATLNNDSVEIDPNIIKPTIYTPESTDPSHHQLYDFSHGLKFSCQSCVHAH